MLRSAMLPTSIAKSSSKTATIQRTPRVANSQEVVKNLVNEPYPGITTLAPSPSRRRRLQRPPVEGAAVACSL
ncbi:hypothetical protein P7K49_005039, partial [Saguinus oedipus]